MRLLRGITKHPTISLVSSTNTLNELRQIHAQLLVNDLVKDGQTLGQFVASIAIRNPINLHYSNLILNQCQTPTLFALNSMIRVYSKTSNPHNTFHFYDRLLRSNLTPDKFTLNFMIRAAAKLPAREAGTPLHGTAVKHGLVTDAHVHCALISMYAEAGLLSPCRRVYAEVPLPDVVSQTAMVNACAKCGDVDYARKVFDKMTDRDYITWNAMIGGYAHCGRPREALGLFSLMQAEGVKVSEVSMVLVLSACSDLGELNHGRWAHAYVVKSRMRLTVSVGTALVDMYAKCRAMKKAMKVFFEMEERNVYTWNAAIGGLAANGLGEECLELFLAMKRSGIEPNEVTFAGLMRGCVAAGLVEKGRELFCLMREVYKIEPRSEHYDCLANLYA